MSTKLASRFGKTAKRKVIVLIATVGQAIHHAVSRNVKHTSVIACVSSAEISLFPYVVTSQNSPTVHEHLNKQGSSAMMQSTFSQRQGCPSSFLHYIRPRSSRSLVLPFSMFSSGVRGMNCRPLTIIRRSNSQRRYNHDFR
jgi:hypothetical protein